MQLPDIKPLCPLDFRDPFRKKELLLPHAWAVQMNRVQYTAPRGMLSDGASIPRLLWRLCPPLYDLHRPGATLHDAAYKGVLRAANSRDAWMPVEREEADMIFWYMCLWNRMRPAKAWTMYKGVSVWGQRAWNREHAKYRNLNLRKLDYNWEKRYKKTVSLPDMVSGKVPGYLIQVP